MNGEAHLSHSACVAAAVRLRRQEERSKVHQVDGLEVGLAGVARKLPRNPPNPNLSVRIFSSLINMTHYFIFL